MKLHILFYGDGLAIKLQIFQGISLPEIVHVVSSVCSNGLAVWLSSYFGREM